MLFCSRLWLLWFDQSTSGCTAGCPGDKFVSCGSGKDEKVSSAKLDCPAMDAIEDSQRTGISATELEPTKSLSPVALNPPELDWVKGSDPAGTGAQIFLWSRLRNSVPENPSPNACQMPGQRSKRWPTFGKHWVDLSCLMVLRNQSKIALCL